MSLIKLKRDLKEVFKLLFPSKKEKKYIRLIKKSQLFDKNHYQRHTSLNYFQKKMPIRHYVLFGEKQNQSPLPNFSPDIYLKKYPDIAAENPPPFEHYLLFGRKENRSCELDTPILLHYPSLQGVCPKKSQSIAIVLHIHYPELWPELKNYIMRCDYEYDLYCTISIQSELLSDNLIRTITQFKCDAVCITVPNHGRDIFPFLYLINENILDSYSVIIKCHTKKSPHRIDGDAWRQSLFKAIFPRVGGHELIQQFLANDELICAIAQGQILTEEKFWGQNQSKVFELLAKLNIYLNAYSLRFPAGSIYMVKQPIIQTLKALKLNYNDFEVEKSQTDNTTAHAIERVIGFIAQSFHKKIVETNLIPTLKPKTILKAQSIQVSALYLPQFYPIPLNDEAWGKGFTEWHNTTKAQKNFPSHSVPRLPTDLGYYDLRVLETLEKQAALAKEHGISNFCVYFYWFDGKRQLEKPIDQVVKDDAIVFPFYFCWANENWTRTWDGLEDNVLIEQTYSEGYAKALAIDTAKYFTSKNYVKKINKPIFVIYRPALLPNPAHDVQVMRDTWQSLGYEVELGAMMPIHQSHSFIDLFDFMIEMPPHGFVKDESDTISPTSVYASADFEGLMYSYETIVKHSLDQVFTKGLSKKLIRGLMPSWDNTPRKGKQAHMCVGANPYTFEYWLESLIDKEIKAGKKDIHLMINAWNEWAETAILEPCEQFGRSYLKCIKRITDKKILNPVSPPCVTETSS